MAISVEVIPLSGSTDGVGIQVSATAGGDTLIHTGPSSSNVHDQCFLFAVNSATAGITLFFEVGGAAHTVFEEVPAKAGRFPVLVDQKIFGVSAGNSATAIRVGASTSGVIDIVGHVNRVTQT